MPSKPAPVIAFKVGCLCLAILSWLLLWDDEAFARGGSRGLHWGYRPPAGNPFSNLWIMTSPWSAMSGGAIPHHSLSAANWNMGSPSSSGGGHGSYGSFGSGSHSTPTNRSVMFPGASSQMSSTTYSRPTGGGYAPSYYSAPSGGSYSSEPPFQPAYYHNYNDYWHHGYWGGGQLGWAHWDRELGLWTFPRWGLGPMYYKSGYGSYRNPFIAGDATLARYGSVIELDLAGGPDSGGDEDDSSPKSTDLAHASLQERVLKSPEVTAGLKAFDAAREAFRKGDYSTALRKTDESLESLPNDPALHELRGLILFAQGEFRQAAAVVYAVLAVSPGWDWTTLSGMYAEHDVYTQHLRTLENFRKQNTDAPEAAFLVAYHYATCGHHEIAVKHLRNVMKALPDDSLAPHLATLLADAAVKRTSDKTPEAAEPAANAATEKAGTEKAAIDRPLPIDTSKFVGTWRASRGDDARFELTLQEDARYAWVIEISGESQRIEGSFLWSGNQLLLSNVEGTMIGIVTLRSLGGNFNFRLLENAPAEHGLDFDK